MYCYWVCLAEDDDDFVVETTKPLPNEIPGLTEDPKTFIKKNILGRSNEDIAKVEFCYNFKVQNGRRAVEN